MPSHAIADDTAHARVTVEHGTLLVLVDGAWLLTNAPPHLEDVLADGPRGGTRATRMAFDARALTDWDSSLLIFLQQCEAFAEQHRLELDTSGLPEQLPRLLRLARAVPERNEEQEPPAPSIVETVGLAAIGAARGAMEAVRFTGEVAIATGQVIRRRVHMRWREFWVVVQDNSAGALPIVTLIALLVGIIIAFLGVVVLKRFGAGYYVSYLVGFGMLREMGALMTGIIMAGRTGAAFAAELGSMKITEEIDAFVTLGIAPVDHLVMPRLLGLLVMMPLLTIYADFVGIMGGMLVSVSMLDLSMKQFIGGMLTAVTLSDALLGVLKGFIFGYIVGLAGCMKGLSTGSDAGAVGRAATSAVVLGITLIILANAIVDWLAALVES